MPLEQVVARVAAERVALVGEQVARVLRLQDNCHSRWTLRRPSRASVGKEWQTMEFNRFIYL